jgi:hypothetical protein
MDSVYDAINEDVVKVRSVSGKASTALRVQQRLLKPAVIHLFSREMHTNQTPENDEGN